MSQLILLNEVSQRDGIPLPDMVPDAQQIRQAVNGLVLAAQRLVVEVPDDVCMFYMSTISESPSKSLHACLIFFKISSGKTIIIMILLS